jgi:NAD(P)-dependent dehydrogenase (short-subunit alcohol dehydrogenase family)
MFDGEVAWVTGSSTGIGRAVAIGLAEQGCRLVVHYNRSEDEAREVVEEISSSGGEAKLVGGDVADAGMVKRMVGEIEDRYGRLDILVNNAGISGSAVGEGLSLEGWNRLMAVNATGVFLGTTLAAEVMAKAGRGSIVNISSIMGFVGSADGHPGYAASKGAVRLLTKAAAVRWGPHGVRVNSVHPGYMPAMLGGTNAGGRAAKIPLTPLRRLGEPIEVAYGVLFLASDEASFVTGAELVIDGGFIAQ